MGFTSQVKRHVYYQHIRLSAALEISMQRLGILGLLLDDDFEQGSLNCSRLWKSMGRSILSDRR